MTGQAARRPIAFSAQRTNASAGNAPMRRTYDVLSDPARDRQVKQTGTVASRLGFRVLGEELRRAGITNATLSNARPTSPMADREPSGRRKWGDGASHARVNAELAAARPVEVSFLPRGEAVVDA